MHKVIEQTINFYRDVHASWSRSRSHPWPELTAWAKEVKQKDHLLDLGCGNGRLYPLVDHVEKYVAVDPVLEFVEEVREKYQVKVHQAVLPNLPEDLGEFDKIFCIAVVQHLPKSLHTATFQSIFKHLKPGGTLYLTSWNILFQKLVINPFKRTYQIPYQKENESGMRFIYRYTPRYLKKKLQAAGFQIEYVQYGEPAENQGRYHARNLIAKATKPE